MRLLATIGCVVGLLSWGSSSEAGSASEPAVVMVLDASSSMLGKLGSKTKIAVARDVTHDLVDDWDPRVRLGLTAYGHRQANSCKDIEAVVPVSVPETTSFLKKVDAHA